MVQTLWNRVKQGLFKGPAQPSPHGLGLTDIGKKRSANEDAIFVSDDLCLYLVADGMGGHANGDIASALAVETLSKRFANHRNEEPASSLTGAVLASNRRIYEQSQKNTRHASNFTDSGETSEGGMGATLVALAIAGGEAVIAHVGDSRAYRFRGHRLERLTRDHSLAEYAPEGETAPITLQARFKNIVTRALGIEPEVEVEIRREALNKGDLMLLCSDGLTHMLSDRQIEAILTNNHTNESACRALIDAANDCGGKDNISCILVRYD